MSEQEKREQAKLKLRTKLIKKFENGEKNANRVFNNLNSEQSTILSNMAVEIFRRGKLLNYKYICDISITEMTYPTAS